MLTLLQGNVSSEDRRMYLCFIQDIITRLSSHNITVRNWTVLSISALLTIEASHPLYPLLQDIINVFLIGTFLWMSLFYHWKEICYITLYEKVLKLDCSSHIYQLNPRKIPAIRDDLPSFWQTLFFSRFNTIFCSVIIVVMLFSPWVFYYFK